LLLFSSIPGWILHSFQNPVSFQYKLMKSPICRFRPTCAFRILKLHCTYLSNTITNENREIAWLSSDSDSSEV
jgi:hypothetical protein